MINRVRSKIYGYDMEHFFVKKEQMAPCFIMKLWMSLWFLLDKVCGLAHWGSSATDCVFEYLSALNIFHNVMALHNKLHKFQNHMTLCPGLFLKRNWRKMNVCLLKGTQLFHKHRGFSFWLDTVITQHITGGGQQGNKFHRLTKLKMSV